LKSLKEDLSSAVGEKVFDSPNQRISLSTFRNHVDEMYGVFSSGNKRYAHWMLVSSTSMCVSCHTQLPQSADRKFGGIGDIKNLSGEKLFEEAEFMFISRRFDSSLAAYTRLIDGYPKNSLSVDSLNTSVRRVLTIYARVRRDPVGGALQFEKLFRNRKLPEFVRNNSKAWMGLFNIWKKEGPIDVEKSSGKDIISFVEKQLKKGLWDKMIEAGDPRAVTNLRVSGVLYEFLHLHPKGEYTPQMLYYLAKTEEALGSDFFFAINELYLKECIEGYPKSSIAKDCYKEYEEGVTVSYSGSSGTHIPADVQKNLRRLRIMVYGK
ncbi:MAG: hypothetical protein KDD25_09925, partial [Bdellovibrionales bacterium]|nr:hypothetical protein [Bdellovibrionales bacterium]